MNRPNPLEPRWFVDPTTPRDRVEAWTRRVYDEAFAADPYHVDEIVAAVLGDRQADGVFCWSCLSIHQLRRLSAALFSSALAARG